MAGIYIHIPFCRQACHYCNFHFSTSERTLEPTLNAMLQELEQRKEETDGRQIETIYLGGGTPSLLNYTQLQQLLDTVYRLFPVAADAEVTLEANPDDLTEAWVKQLRQTAVNRFSIGVQSFFDEHLKWMNRAHNHQQADAAIKRAQDHGFENITADLIYGIPGMSMEQWQANIQQMVGYAIPHISCYNLTVEEGTALDHFVRTGQARDVDDHDSAEQFKVLISALEQAGFVHYEISNFGKEGWYSRHNTSYWQGKPYLGIGPSAHSFNGHRTRRWNVANNVKYIKGLTGGQAWYEEEQLTDNDRFNELVMTGLRTLWGINMAQLETQFGHAAKAGLLQDAAPYLDDGVLSLKENHLTLSPRGKLISDRVMSDLFRVE